MGRNDRGLFISEICPRRKSSYSFYISLRYCEIPNVNISIQQGVTNLSLSTLFFELRQPKLPGNIPHTINLVD